MRTGPPVVSFPVGLDHGSKTSLLVFISMLDPDAMIIKWDHDGLKLNYIF